MACVISLQLAVLFPQGHAHGHIESASRRATQFYPERLQRVTNGVFDVEKLAFDIVPLRQKKAYPIVPLALDICLVKPAGTHDLERAQAHQSLRLVARSPSREDGSVSTRDAPIRIQCAELTSHGMKILIKQDTPNEHGSGAFFLLV